MDPCWAWQHFAFPATPADEDRHAAMDGSEWRFEASSNWWEIHAYAPDDDDRDIATMRDPARRVTRETAREKVLAEVAASTEHTRVPAEAAIWGIVQAAIGLARTPVDGHVGVVSREHVIAAADLMVLVAVRMDGDR